MNYKVGDTVVCISATPIGSGYVTTLYLHAGASYVVSGLRICCGIAKVLLAGVDNPTGASRCQKCLVSTDGTWFHAWRFIKLDGLLTETCTDVELAENV